MSQTIFLLVSSELLTGCMFARASVQSTDSHGRSSSELAQQSREDKNGFATPGDAESGLAFSRTEELVLGSEQDLP